MEKFSNWRVFQNLELKETIPPLHQQRIKPFVGTDNMQSLHQREG
jgi:hypothetical protein